MIQRNRKIGLPLATMLVAGNMIGSGIYLLPASLAAVGSITVIGWMIATVGALVVALVLSRLGQIAPTAGGLCTYPGQALGPLFGFQANVLYWTCAWIGNIAIALAAIGYLGHFFDVLKTPLFATLGLIALIWLVTVVNIFGPRFACQVQSLTLVAGLIPILLVATVGWTMFDSDRFIADWNRTGEPFVQVIPTSLVLVFWAFVGLESASVGTAVVENPARNVPLATLGGVLLAGVVYIAACAAIMGIVPSQILAASTAPFADATQAMFGSSAGALIAAMAFIKATGTLCGWVLLTAQVGKAAADRKLFPAVLSRVDKDGIPVTNLIFMASLMTVVGFVTMSPTLNQQFNKLIEASVVLCLLTYIYACLSVSYFEREHGSAGKRYVIAAAVAIAFCVFVIAQSQASTMWWSLALVGLATLMYFAFVRRRSIDTSVAPLPQVRH